MTAIDKFVSDIMDEVKNVIELDETSAQEEFGKLQQSIKKVIETHISSFSSGGAEKCKRVKKVKEVNKRAPTLTAYFIYSSIHKDEYTHIKKCAERTKACSEEWKKLTDSDKKYYQDLSEKYNAESKRVFDVTKLNHDEAKKSARDVIDLLIEEHKKTQTPIVPTPTPVAPEEEPIQESGKGKKKSSKKN